MIEDLLIKMASGKPIHEVKKPFMRFLRFKVGKEEFLIDLPLVVEITEPKALYPVPNSAYFLLGLINHRGNVIPIYDIRTIFNIYDVRKSNESCYIILSFQDENVGLFVDQVIDVVEVYDEKDILEGDEFISDYGIIMDNKKLNILDIELILNKR
ncbi:MAG: chemotaxis protein CheW [Deferribacterales bacterium]